MSKLPSRLHHTAYVTKDLEATRHFYEDILGLPLIATWCEKDFLFGKDRTYCHCFFGIGDGGALAFFQFADPEDQAQFGPEIPATPFMPSRAQRRQGNASRARRPDQGRRARSDLYARARLLPFGLRGRSQRHDRRVHLRRSASRGRRRVPPLDRPRRAQALARRRPPDQQRLPSRRSGLRADNRVVPFVIPANAGTQRTK